MRTLEMLASSWIAFVLGSNSAGCLLADDTAEPVEQLGHTESAIGTPVWPISGVSAGTCYHVPGSGAHKPSGGISNADELYALDLNCSGGSEGGKAVRPIRSGTVRATGAGSNVAGQVSSSYVLVEHPESVIVDGIAYTRFFTAYLHMKNIAVSSNTPVTTSSTLGLAADIGAPGATHLHFAAYVGEYSGGNWGRLRSFNPALLGGGFAAYDYTSYIYRRWVDNSMSGGSYAFIASGTPSDLFTSSSYGMHGSMRYTTTRSSAPDDNSFEFKWNAAMPARRGYYVWPFIPANFGTTTNANYKLLKGLSTTTSNQGTYDTWVVNQNSISDDYAFRTKRIVNAGEFVTLKVGDFTAETGRWLAGDHAVLFWKADHCLGGCSFAAPSEQGYCLQANYSTSNALTSCPASPTIPIDY
jgi:hypothetical protein